ncbi:MAG TPA: GTPase ObgE [Patescibacteria group bacterium]|nr:GTPase ObgE [Patescibacteria group bacterium]
MLKDTAKVTFKGGKGGDGANTFRAHRKGQDGGNGGNGGSLYVVARQDLKLLNQFSRVFSFSAEDGIPGSDNRKSGKNGEDLIIYLPVGTSIIEQKSGKEICSLSQIGEKVLIAKGGKGGRGNWEFRMEQVTPVKPAEKGTKGEVRELILSLKLIADFGLIGLPNAGKSSLLNELTGAHAKTANYPFTTLSPALGIFEGRVIADIPGLIEGASTGRGLGIGFLKHIEKVKVLLHCVSCESQDVAKDYETVRTELGKFNSTLLEKKEIVLLTKSDLVDEKYTKAAIKKLSKKAPQILSVSVNDWESLEKLKKILNTL